MQVAAADLLIDKTPSSLTDVREAVRKLKGEMAPGICNIIVEILKARAEATILGLHAVVLQKHS